MHAYKPKVNDFVLAPTPAKTFGALQLAGLYFHMALLANISFQDVPAGENTGSEKSMVSHGAAAKVWFQSRQNYDSRHRFPSLSLIPFQNNLFRRDLPLREWACFVIIIRQYALEKSFFIMDNGFSRLILFLP